MIVRPSPLAANYDPDVFPDPLRFDIHRKPKRIMSVSPSGPHHCVGNILGRTTITLAIRRLLARFPHARLADPGFRAGLWRLGRRIALAKPADEDSMSPISRCGFVVSLLTLACWAWPAQSQAPYPSQPIKLIVPYAPGGVPDTTARLLAQRLQERVGQTVVVENRAGGNGGVAAGVIATSPPDGYTLLVVDTTLLSVSPLVREPAHLQSAEGFRADRGAGAHTAVSGGQRHHADQDAAGFRRSREGQPRQDQLRLGGNRQHAPSHHGSDEVRAQSRRHACSLSGHQPGGAGPARRSRPGVVGVVSESQGWR